MKKQTTDSVWAIVILFSVFLTGYGLGETVAKSRVPKTEYAKGVADGLQLNDGDKWLCKRTDNSTVCNRIKQDNGV